MGWQASVLILLLGALAHAAVPGGSCGSCGCNWEGQHHPEAWSQDYSSGIHPGTFHSVFCSLPRNWDLQPTSELLISFVSWKQSWSPLSASWFQRVRQCSGFLLDVERELWPLPWELPSVWKLLLFSVILCEPRKDLFPFPVVLLKTKPTLEYWVEKTNGRKGWKHVGVEATVLSGYFLAEKFTSGCWTAPWIWLTTFMVSLFYFVIRDSFHLIY